MGKFVLTAILLTINTVATDVLLTILMTVMEFSSMNQFPEVCKNQVREMY